MTLDGAVVESTDFENDDGGWTAAPPPEGTDYDDANWTRATQQFTEGGIVGTTDTIYTGFGFEGMNAAARPEFMKRALHLPRRDQGHPRPGQPRARPAGRRTRRGDRTPAAKHASAKIKSSKRLRASRNGPGPLPRDLRR